MIPIKFKESNKILIRPHDMTEEECGNLPVFNDDDQCVSCWKFNLKERLSVLFFGNVWLSVLSGKTQPSVWLMAKKSCFE